MSPDERQPWELADEESGSPRKAVPATSEPIEEEERGEAAREPSEDGRPPKRAPKNGAPDWNNDGEPPPERSHPEEGELGAGSQYAAEDSEEHSEPKGPAGGAAGPR